jgi:DNA modification methylase
MPNLSYYLDRVFNLDVLKLIARLPSNSIDCIYADPDYNVGVKYNDISYRKKFDDYVDWCISWCKESLRVLKEDGNFFVINYPKNNAYLRTRYLDSAFYNVHEYVWVYNTNIGHTKNRFTTAHRSILHCTRSPRNKFFKENIAVDFENPTDKRIKKLIANGIKGRMPYSWSYFDLVKNVGFTKSFHSCQIPEGLSRRLIHSCTRPGDNVLILFGGSGSEIIVSKESGRHFISAEIDSLYYDLIRERLKRADGGVPSQYRLLSRMRNGHKANRL